MKKLLTILLVLISLSSFAQFEAGEFVNSDAVKIDGVPLLLNTFKQGNLGGAGNIFYSTGASSQPASGSVNQVIGGNSLTENYVPKWDGSKLANSSLNYSTNAIMQTSSAPYYIFNALLYSRHSEIGMLDGANMYVNNTSEGNLYLGSANGVYLAYNGGTVIIGNASSITQERLDVNGNAIADVLKSRVPTGTAPLVVASSTVVENLNAGLLDGKHASDFQLKSDTSTFDATISDLADSAAAIRALANTKATISGTDNFIMKKTGDNTLGNSLAQSNDTGIGIGVDANRTLHIGASGQPTFAFSDTRGGIDQQEMGFLYDAGLALTRPGMVFQKLGNDGSFSRNLFTFFQNGTINFDGIAYPDSNAVVFGSKKIGAGTNTPAARIHSQSTTTQLRLGYDATKYTDLSTSSAGTFNISPSGGFTNFSGGISASAYSTFTGQVEMTGDDVNFGASTVLRKSGLDIFTAPITMGACGSAGQVLSSTGPNSAPTWTTPATGSGSGITSIGIQVPTGLTVNPTSLTANGTFTIGLQSGYSIPTTAKQSQWDAGYTYRLTSASGTSPLTLSLSNNALTGSLNSTLTNIGNVNPSTGYLYWNGSAYSYQAATTTYTLPTASSSTLGGVQIDNADGGLYMSGGWLLQKDNVLTARTPILTDPIAFYDASATAQGKTTFAEIRTIMNGVQTLTSASSITMNFATAPKASLSLATNSTITITNVPDGGEGSIEVTSSGAYTLAIAGSTGYTTIQKMGTVAAIASSAHTTVFYWRSGTVLYYGFLLNN